MRDAARAARLAGSARSSLIGVAGASVIERYLAVPALALMVFAAVALGGWTMLVPGRAAHRLDGRRRRRCVRVRRRAYTATHLNLSRFDNELRFRGQAHHDLDDGAARPEGAGRAECGPLTGPNHKLVPDSRWIADLPTATCCARARRAAATAATAPPRPSGVAIVVTSRFAIFKHAWTDPPTTRRIQVPPRRLPARQDDAFYAAYVRC